MSRRILTVVIGTFAVVSMGYALSKESSSEVEKRQNPVAEPNLITFSNIDKAWKYSHGQNTKVAVLDWCFDMSPRASGKYVNPTSLVPGQPIGHGEPWHGEWMAEIVHQIAPEAKIIPIQARPASEKELDENGRYVYEKYLIQGIRFAADQGAVAVTNSMGPVTHCKELEDAIDYAEKKGTIFIDVHPERIIKGTVTREPDRCDRRIIHSGVVSVPNHPMRPEAGRDVYVWPYQIKPVFQDGWGFSQGPPIVAGVIALMKSANPDMTPQQIRTIIIKTACIKDGFKILDAESAVKATIKLKSETERKK